MVCACRIWLAGGLTAFAAACGGDRPAPAAPAPVVHQPRPLRAVTFERTSVRVARGQYLAEGILQCFVCHSERAWTKPGAPPVAGREGAGTVWWNKSWLVAPNLTPDAETGIGRWTDDMLARAIREGISHDGRVLHTQMWYRSFRRLADEDVAAVIVYLRSLRPIRNPLPATSLPEDVAGTLDVPEPLTEPVPLADAGDPMARARYLVDLADCSGCHTSWYTPKNPGLFGGGNLIERSGRRAYGANITRDSSGLEHYDAAFFREVMRTGRAKGRTLSPLMPWVAFRHLNDADLDAMFAYFGALRPVKHLIDNVNPPALCAVCGGTHPLGEYNKPREIQPRPYTLAEVGDVAGRYRFESGWMVKIEVAGSTLTLREDEPGAPSCPLITENGREFFCKDEVDYFTFVRGADGRATGLLNNGVDPAVRLPSSRRRP